MKLKEFSNIISHIQNSSYPKRGVFVTDVTPKILMSSMSSLDVHQYELVTENINPEAPVTMLESRLNDICSDYLSIRKEPAAMMILDANLILSYGLSLSLIYSKNVVTPRSLVLFCVPPGISDERLMGLSNIVEQDFSLPMKMFQSLLSEPDSIIEE